MRTISCSVLWRPVQLSRPNKERWRGAKPRLERADRPDVARLARRAVGVSLGARCRRRFLVGRRRRARLRPGRQKDLQEHLYVMWSSDGHWLFLWDSLSSSQQKAVAVPLSAGRVFPDFPSDDADAIDLWQSLPGARTLDPASVGGLDPSTYVSVKTEELRNLFRVPLPSESGLSLFR